MSLNKNRWKGELDPQSELSNTEQVQQREALGWSKGGFSTKIHLRIEGNGLPLTFLVTVGERHEAVVFEELMEQGAVPCTLARIMRNTEDSLTRLHTASVIWLSVVSTVSNNFVGWQRDTRKMRQTTWQC